MRSFRTVLNVAATILAGLAASPALAAAPPAPAPAAGADAQAKPPPPGRSKRPAAPAPAQPRPASGKPAAGGPATPASGGAAPSVATAAEQPGEIGGTVELDGGKVVVLPEPPPVGEMVQTAEGWFRLEEAPERENGTGSFVVLAAEPAAPEPPARKAEALPAEPADPCAALAAQAAACEADRREPPGEKPRARAKRR